MFQVIHLVDITEPLNLVIGPLFYLYIKAKIDESSVTNIFVHFLPSILYFFYSLPFYLQNTETKYNAYINQYHPQLSHVPVPGGEFEYLFLLGTFIDEFTVVSIAAYLIMATVALYQAKKCASEEPFAKNVLSNLWVDIVFIATILATLIFVKTYFSRGFGEFLIITVISIYIYSSSIKVIRASDFFKKPVKEKKYVRSVLDEETKMKILAKINLMMDKKYYLNYAPSLPDLAKKINASPNYTSQVINEKLNLTFLELIAKHRIDEAKMMILDHSNSKTIEEIGYSVGFNSKSTFYTAFKKLTGQTPSAFKKSQSS